MALIKKQRPDWQKGQWNGIGGKVEEGENPEDAMRREFREETGLDTENWRYFCRFSGEGWVVQCFRAFSDNVSQVKTTTDEDVVVWAVGEIPEMHIPNLDFLIPMALTTDGDYQITGKVWKEAA